MYWELRDERFEPARKFGLDACIECGCCDVVCPSHLPLTRYFRWGKGQLHRQTVERERAEHARQRFEARNARIGQQKAQREARLAAKREALEKARSDGNRGAAIDEIIARKKSSTAGNDDSGQTG
jgi:electron transport complex protein RnfC